jgi:hypothetical protein
MHSDAHKGALTYVKHLLVLVQLAFYTLVVQVTLALTAVQLCVLFAAGCASVHQLMPKPATITWLQMCHNVSTHSAQQQL